MPKNARVTVFTVSDLLRENEQEGLKSPPPPKKKKLGLKKQIKLDAYPKAI